ncbi:serine protease [Amycolatopsis sp. BJA-103]|uniref:S1 family peptidase n=1 Tax=Amycolatopsis sp. BJA-103 TaxID=1911175 RepID=UPI000CA19180|nr:serine protease [Amycolatopsis sp. BJA-103]AUI59949.1 serine protease [Amycolatopsis sp. BJA-103]PNE13700.1 serine protease [Amycolatopsis sp. BJA-103]
MTSERRRWRVRLRDHRGRILGAGTMLDHEHLLTCAHVIEGHEDVTVDFVALPGVEPGIATIVARADPIGDDGGDVALLRLRHPEEQITGAPLHRTALEDNQRVRAYGFPSGSDGMWSLATVVGDGGHGLERVQLHRTPDAEPITHGFSGSAVIADRTGHVVGMVATRYTTEAARVSWMIPVETLLGYLPELRRWAEGSPAIDPSFVHYPEPPVIDVLFAREFASWLGGYGRSDVRVIIMGADDSAVAGSLRRAIFLADREHGAGRSASGPTVPPVGSVVLAVDAVGKTADEVRRRISERLDVAADSPAGRHGTGRTVVVYGIDESAEPDELVGEVLLPLAQRAHELGLRLALAFRKESSPGVSVVRSSTEVLPDGEDDIEGRLASLETRLDELARLEKDNLSDAPRFFDAPEAPARVRRLKGALTQLRSAERDGEPEWVKRHLPACERTVARAGQRARDLRRLLDENLARRAELRARLDAYGEMARNSGLVEDVELDAAYAPAWRRLFEGPCDLGAAAAAVERYADTVRKRIDG